MSDTRFHPDPATYQPRVVADAGTLDEYQALNAIYQPSPEEWTAIKLDNGLVMVGKFASTDEIDEILEENEERW